MQDTTRLITHYIGNTATSIQRLMPKAPINERYPPLLHLHAGWQYTNRPLTYQRRRPRPTVTRLSPSPDNTPETHEKRTTPSLSNTTTRTRAAADIIPPHRMNNSAPVPPCRSPPYHEAFIATGPHYSLELPPHHRSCHLPTDATRTKGQTLIAPQPTKPTDVPRPRLPSRALPIPQPPAKTRVTDH